MFTIRRGGLHPPYFIKIVKQNQINPQPYGQHLF